MKACLKKSGSDWDPVFVSDRQKGILSAVTELYPGRGHRFCVRHIMTNTESTTSKLSPLEQSWIFKMARSECENDFKFYRSKLADTRSKAGEYLDVHGVTYVFNETYNQPSYDEVTSNMSESANNWLGNDCRSSYPLHAFERYFVKVVETFAARRQKVVRGVRSYNPDTSNAAESAPLVAADGVDDLVPSYKKQLNEMLGLTKVFHITPCLEWTYLVRFTDGRKRPDHVHL
ncbi:hypothetical protein PHMEG_00028451 [Phytophthora megakarya]|uniref:MULE transposase domain-containing protein n=1 Tax=Phytophthora megakarya TaxID=4795 RepID=A0A225V4X2_9STRA|nr:hypothetical protein PHMEG_00028451 [Phytophthora megakarya]